MTETRTTDQSCQHISNDLGTLDQEGRNDSDDAILAAALSHQIGLVVWFVGPLAIYLASDDRFVKKHASEALSWQLNLAIYVLVAIMLTPMGISALFIMLFTVINVILSVIGSIKATYGEYWNYPISKNYMS